MLCDVYLNIGKNMRTHASRHSLQCTFWILLVHGYYIITMMVSVIIHLRKMPAVGDNIWHVRKFVRVETSGVNSAHSLISQFTILKNTNNYMHFFVMATE